jgi:hypothetical protein
MSTRILIALSALAVFLSFPAWVSADTCVAMGDPAFSASFEWKAENGAGHKMSVRIARDTADAQILSGNQCLAVCRVKPDAPETEIGRTIASIRPRQIDLDCTASDFAALTGPATLIFRGVGVDTPMIRFGTWLDGYREASLTVQADRLEPARSVQREARGIDRKPAIAELEVH